MNSWCHCTVLRAGIQRLDHTMYPPGTEEVPMLAEEPQVICLWKIKLDLTLQHPQGQCWVSEET